MAQQAKETLTGLTSLRGIAAIFVMLHHFMFAVALDVGKWIPSKLFFKAYLWVDLFFILSGFILAYIYHNTFNHGVSRSEYRNFIQSRFARIYPLHFFMLVLFVAFEVVQWLLYYLGAQGMENLPPPFSGNESPETLVTNLLLVQTLHWEAYWNEPAWSISAEWMIYFILPFMLHRLLPLQANRIPLAVVLAFMPLILIEWHFGDLGLYYAGWPMLFRCLCGAGIGMLVFQCYEARTFARLGSKKLLNVAFFLNLVALALPLPDVVSVAGFGWLLLCVSRLPPEQRHLLNSPLLAYFGKISYSIYLVHWLFVEVIRDTTRFFLGVSVSEAFSFSAQIVLILGMCGVVIVFSHVTYRLIESPMRQRLKSRHKLKRRNFVI